MNRSYRLARLLIIILLSVSLSSCSKPPKQPVELTVSAAASLKDALTELKTTYEEQHDVRITYNFGASGALQQQIEQGAPVDLYISAGQNQMEALRNKGLVGVSPILLRNELVLIVPKKPNDATSAKPSELAELTDASYKTIAIGAPESVPVGSYTKQSLADADIWDEIEPKVVFAKDVRQVLSYVETGNADAGFVYLTDARTSTKVTIALTVAAETHKPIVYPATVVKETKHQEEALELLGFLQSEEAGRVWKKYGFILP
ncbi:molybdate ABC transporter substrate-binding protein [Paenibacillus lignilyticus]|uniref:Molybdate ABC transporter substrate-binding protein n=1 Tax=Paenibacillus lignilyticus TaxID=1172615 RepID=A0ABS5CAJ0_9BACL|nr:molybdate ABC transporter substrate-binding protein [Paenibacillus lignilyticus]MBP3962465.1 molybdate ABC transporter substrate-binding protein [Paenibacillus lignilyticus]